MTTYKSDIKLGQEYEHIRTGLIGHATAIYFFENACERVSLMYLHDGEVKNETFDAIELRNKKTGKTSRSDRTGGERGPSSPPRAQ